MPTLRKNELFPSPLNLYLHDTFRKKRNKNSRYSLRAFARDLGLPASQLSEILSGKSVPGSIVSRNIVESLKLGKREKLTIESMITEHRKLQKEYRGARELQEDELVLISEWQHYAIFCMMSLDVFKSNPDWIAARLGLKKETVTQALSRLQRLGLLKIVNDRFVPVHKRITTTNDIPSQVLRKSHAETLEHAIQSLSRDRVEVRDFSSMTFCMDMEKLPEAKRLITNFRRKMATLMESGKKEEVYNLNIQLVPITIPTKEELK